MNQILQYLKTNGERLDAEIAAAAGLSLAKTRLYLAELAAKGEIMAYHSTRFLEGQKSKGYVAGWLASPRPQNLDVNQNPRKSSSNRLLRQKNTPERLIASGVKHLNRGC